MGKKSQSLVKRGKNVQRPALARRSDGRADEDEVEPVVKNDRSKRLLDLVMMLLQARTPIPYREIRRQFVAYQTANPDAGLRAFERDKAELLELGVPIRYIAPDEEESLDEGGYLVDLKRFRLPEVHLTADEISALILAASIARAVPGEDTARVVDLALKKLAFDSRPEVDTPSSPAPAQSNVVVHFSRNVDKALSERFALLEQATRLRKEVHFVYRSPTSAQNQARKAYPYGLIYREGSWLLVGYCLLRQDVRSFRLDRMTDVTMAPKPKTPDFERPAHIDVRTFANRSPWTFETGPAEDVTLEFLPGALAVFAEDFGPGAERGQSPAANPTVQFTCGNLEWAALRILAAKGTIIVKNGPRLKSRVAQEIAKIKELYV